MAVFEAKEWRRANDKGDSHSPRRTAQWAQSHYALQREIASRKKAEASLRDLSARLLQLQDEERRRIARELHDSTSQKLAASSMSIALLRRAISANPRATALLEECAALVEECSTEIRTISYLLHPPALDELGLASALRWAVTGFAKRSGIEVTLDIPEDLGRFPRDVELAVYRVVQEALTNVHRHSRSRTARVSVSHDAAGLTVSIVDQGRGFPTELLQREAGAALGVGIAGMRERVRQLGGFLEINSASSGTRITVHMAAVETVAAAA